MGSFLAPLTRIRPRSREKKAISMVVHKTAPSRVLLLDWGRVGPLGV